LENCIRKEGCKEKLGVMILESQRAKISFGERTGERRTDFEKEEKYRR
jgi:hypothetical protein